MVAKWCKNFPTDRQFSVTNIGISQGVIISLVVGIKNNIISIIFRTDLESLTLTDDNESVSEMLPNKANIFCLLE